MTIDLDNIKKKPTQQLQGIIFKYHNDLLFKYSDDLELIDQYYLEQYTHCLSQVDRFELIEEPSKILIDIINYSITLQECI